DASEASAQTPAREATPATARRRISRTSLGGVLSGVLRGALASAVLIWLGSRLLLVAYTLVASLLTAPDQATGWSAGAALQVWQRSDANWYLLIAQDGYTWPGDIVFFPLYPLLIFAGERFAGAGHGLLVALAISNIAALVAFLGLAKLAADDQRP